MSYTPPASFPAAIALQPPSSPYSPPSSFPASIQFGDDVPPGNIGGVTASDQSAFGAAFVAFRVRSVAPAGIASTLTFGSPALYNTRQYVNADGIASTLSFGDAVLYLRNQYVFPSAIQQSGWFGDFQTTMTPVEIAFQPPTSYTPPTVFPANLPFIDLLPSQILAPSLGNTSSFGAPVVDLRTRYVTPSGFIGTTFGAPTFNVRQQIVPVGFNAFKDFGFGAGGDGFVDFAIRRRYPAGIYATTFGTAFLSGGLRYVGVPHFVATSFGTAFVSYKERVIEPLFFVATHWGTAQVGRHQTIYPAGFIASLFGSSEVFDNRKRAYPPGFFATQFGSAFIAPRVRNVYPVGFWSRTPSLLPDERWGRPEVYNKRQYVRQYYEVTPDDGGVFGRWHDIANRNRRIQAYGWRTDKISLTNLIELKGVALTPAGFVATQFGNTLIAYRIRTVTTIGEDTSLFTQWANVRNTAQVRAVSGFDALRIGTPAVVNTRRYFTYIGAGDQGAFGAPFVAPRVRTIAPYYSYEGGEVKEPLVTLGRRYVRPVGIAPKEVGAATVEEHFNIIRPRWAYADRLGVPTLHNVTPELGAYGHDSAAFGATAIRNQFQRYALTGFKATIFGNNTLVEYRTKQVNAPGIAAIRWGPNTRIRNIIPDPPSPQTLQPEGWDSSFPLPTGTVVRSNVIFPSGSRFTAFGVPRVVSMGIGPAGGIYLIDQFGVPSLNSTQHIRHSNLRESTEYGNPRLSPWTIWASTLTPVQAIVNHPPRNVYEVMDSALHLDDMRPAFGGALVTHKNRRVSHFHRAANLDYTVGERFGEPAVTNRFRRIFPVGFKAFKYGFPVLNGGGAIGTQGDEMLLMGTPNVSHYINPLIPRYVRPDAWESFDYGQPVVRNFKRYIAPSGIDATAFGTARLHPPEPVIPEGFRADVYGDTVISNFIRNVYPVGVEPLEIDYVNGSFVDRMRVSERHTLLPFTVGDVLRMGTPMVSNKVRTIRPTDEIVGVVSAPTVTARSYVSVAAYGIDAGAFGDVQRWEAGKIKPYGDDMLQPGYPRMGRTITPASILGQIGAPRIGQPIRPTGMFTQVIGDATITHGDNLDYVCGQTARGIPVPGNHFGVFGIPVVS